MWPQGRPGSLCVSSSWQLLTSSNVRQPSSRAKFHLSLVNLFPRALLYLVAANHPTNRLVCLWEVPKQLDLTVLRPFQL
jgi:hypothetical protein